MMSQVRLVRVLVLALTLGLFSPWNPVVETFMSGAVAVTPPTVTQTITVRGYNSSPLANAEIVMWYGNGDAEPESATVLTNGAGVGVLTVPQSTDTATDYTFLVIQPPLGARQNAYYVTDVFDRTSSRSTTITLEQVIFKFKIVADTDTTTVLSASWIDYCELDSNGNPIDSACRNSPPLKSSSGVYLKPSTTYSLRAHEPIGSQFVTKEFIIDVNGAGAVTSVTADLETVSQDASGNYVLTLDRGNLFGVIRDSAGQAIPGMGQTGGASINLEKWIEDGAKSRWTNFGNGAWSNDGTFRFRVSDPGKYRLHAYPYNIGDYDEGYSSDIIISDADSITVISTSGETKNSIVLKLPTPNFRFKLVDPKNLANIVPNSYAEFCEPNRENCKRTGWLATARSVYLKPSTTYTMTINGPDASNYGIKEVTIVVNGAGAMTVTSGAQTFTPGGSNIYALPLQSSNFLFKIVKPTDTATIVADSYADYCELDSNGDQINSSCNGTNYLAAASGVYLKASTTYVFRIHGPNGSKYAAKEFTITVNGSGVVTSVISSSETATQDGSGNYALALEAANLAGVIRDSAGQTLSGIAPNTGKGLSVNLEKWTTDSRNNSYWQGIGGGAWSEDGTFSLRVSDPGKYRIHAYPQGVGDYTEGFSGDIFVSNADSITVISTSGETRTSILVKLPTPNFRMLVNNPLTSTGLTSGNVQIESVTAKNRDFYTGVNLNPSSAGVALAKLIPGTYIVTIYPWGNSGAFITGLAANTYNVTVSPAETITVTASDGVTPVYPNGSGRFILSAASANLSGHIVDASGNSVGSSNSSQVNLTLFKLRSDGLNWDWIAWANTDRDGFFSMFVSTAGTYRIRIEPNGLGYASSYTPNFILTGASDKLNLGDLVLAAPTLKVRVTAAGLPAVAYTGIEIRKNNDFVDWVGTGSDGVASINLTQPGKYELIVNPSDDVRYSLLTRKSYTITLSVANGTSTVTYNGTQVNSTLDLALGAATLSGHVYAPGSTTPIGNSNVVAVDQATGQEMWMNSANTSSGTGADAGIWAMSLPDGRYKVYARAPWGDSTYANSDLSVLVTVTGGGTSVSPANPLNIHLQTPKWSGVVKAPTGNTVIANASVCLNLIVSGLQSWNCTNTDNSGNWAINPPAAFTVFDTYTSRLEVRENFNPQYSNLVMTNKDSLTAALPLAGGTGIVLRLLNPNTSITVVAPRGESTANLWVNLDVPNVGWVGGAATNAQGVARFNLANPAQAVNARVELNGNADLAGIYAATTLTIAAQGGRIAVSDTLTLSLPNLRGIVKDPATGAVLGNTWVDLMDKSKNQGVGGANTDQNGFFALNAPAPQSGTSEYLLTVNPPWNGSSTSTRKTYSFVVQTNGTGVLKDAGTGSSVATETYGSSPAYSMSLASPSITGVVMMPDSSTVANSWITPTLVSTGEVQWQYGSNSRNDGSFGLAITDGTYSIEANIPWNVSGVAKSAPCTVTVRDGAVTTVGGCVVAGPSVQLRLRSPNLAFTIKDSSDVVLPYAHVGIQIGNWHTDAQSDATGNVGIFLSHSDFTAASTGLVASSTQKIHLVVDPPYGNSDVVRLDCNSGDAGTPCASLPTVTIGGGTDPSNLSIVAKLAAPNTRLRVNKPDGTSIGAGAWVSLLAIPKSNINTRVWIAGSVTDSSGWATFNVDTSTIYDSFTVEINPPGDQRETYSTKTYGNSGSTLTFATVNNNSSTFRLASPNLVLKVLASDSTINKWGWVGVELIDGINSSWLGGYGIDEKGVVALSLAVNTGGTYYRVSSNPSSGRSGARTICRITNTAGTLTVADLPGCGAIVAGSETITLNAGNVTGKVTANAGGTAITGAIVYANWSNATGDTTSVVTATDANGNYGLQLDTSRSWIIKVFPTLSSDVIKYADHLSAAFTPTENTTKDIKLLSK